MMDMIIKTLAGSRAYGLETEGSDWDFHGVYATPTSKLLSIGPTPATSVWQSGDTADDFQSWELGHFLHLATKCNPTVLETFVAPVVVSEDPTLILSYGMDIAPPPPGAPYALTIGEGLRALFPYVLARKRVFDAFRGYAHNQRAKLFSKPDDPTAPQPTGRAWKFATQYLRVLLQGERLLLTGELVLDMTRYGIMNGAPFLMDVRNGKFSMGHVIDKAAELEAKLKEAYEDSDMQEEPDLDAVNDFLLKVRRENW